MDTEFLLGNFIHVPYIGVPFKQRYLIRWTSNVDNWTSYSVCLPGLTKFKFKQVIIEVSKAIGQGLLILRSLLI